MIYHWTTELNGQNRISSRQTRLSVSVEFVKTGHSPIGLLRYPKEIAGFIIGSAQAEKGYQPTANVKKRLPNFFA